MKASTPITSVYASAIALGVAYLILPMATTGPLNDLCEATRTPALISCAIAWASTLAYAAITPTSRAMVLLTSATAGLWALLLATGALPGLQFLALRDIDMSRAVNTSPWLGLAAILAHLAPLARHILHQRRSAFRAVSLMPVSSGDNTL